MSIAIVVLYAKSWIVLLDIALTEPNRIIVNGTKAAK